MYYCQIPINNNKTNFYVIKVAMTIADLKYAFKNSRETNQIITKVNELNLKSQNTV
jgi:hypothetical protein